MNNEELHQGTTVWITTGPDKGRKGTVDYKGFGQVSVHLDGERKTFMQYSVTTKNPAHTVPLPPNFLPLDHKVGDTVIVKGFHHLPQYNDVVGVVTRVPTGVASSGFTARSYRIIGAKSSAFPDVPLDFLPEFLKPFEPERVEGEEIRHEDVKVGDTIRTELHSSRGGYSQMSSKQGKVHSITYSSCPTSDAEAWEHYVFKSKEDGYVDVLNYRHRDEKIILVKAGESKWISIVKELKTGSVVVRENTNGTVTTFVKSVNWGGSSQWHSINSLSNKSSSFVSDSDVIRVLETENAKVIYSAK